MPRAPVLFPCAPPCPQLAGCDPCSGFPGAVLLRALAPARISSAKPDSSTPRPCSTARPWVPARRRSSTAAHGLLPCARSASSPSSSLRAEVARSSPARRCSQLALSARRASLSWFSAFLSRAQRFVVPRRAEFSSARSRVLFSTRQRALSARSALISNRVVDLTGCRRSSLHRSQSSPSSPARSPPHQLAPNTISSSFRASARNPKNRVKTKLAAWCSPSAR
jgi:hypothetical protein